MKNAVQPIPEGHAGIIPYFSVADANALLAFLKQGFGAEETFRMADPSGVVRHAEVRLNGALLMVGQSPNPRPSTIYMYVTDVDAAYKRAMSAPHAKSLREPTDEFYGDRSSGVEDAQGNQFWIATHVEDVSAEELTKRAAAAKP